MEYKFNATKIKEIKDTDEVAIHCPKLEYVRPLFEGLGLQTRGDAAIRDWDRFKRDTCYHFYVAQDGGWICGSLSNKGAYENFINSIISFEDLIIPEENNLIKTLHAVGGKDLEWLQEGVEFMFGSVRYRISEEWVEYWSEVMQRWQTALSSTILTMIYNRSEIRPVRQWSEETIKDAKAAIRLYGKDAKVGNINKSGKISILTKDGFWLYCLNGDIFKDVKQGETIPLNEIVNN